MNPGDPIRVIVVDDEPLGRDRIRMFAEARGDLRVIAECADGPTAIQAIRDKQPDLVFLDVQMPGLDGIEVVKEIGPDQMPAVIFVTAFDEYALKAFEVHALDYLLKPFRPDRFFEAVDRVVQLIREESHGSGADLKGLVAGRIRPIDRILVKGSRKAHFVRVSDINWVEAAGNYLRLHVGEKVYLIRQTMKQLERQLDPDSFVRIHRSVIVNLSGVRELARTSSGEYEAILADGKRLKVSRGYRRELDRFDPLAQEFSR